MHARCPQRKSCVVSRCGVEALPAEEGVREALEKEATDQRG